MAAAAAAAAAVAVAVAVAAAAPEPEPEEEEEEEVRLKPHPVSPIPYLTYAIHANGWLPGPIGRERGSYVRMALSRSRDACIPWQDPRPKLLIISRKPRMRTLCLEPDADLYLPSPPLIRPWTSTSSIKRRSRMCIRTFR